MKVTLKVTVEAVTEIELGENETVDTVKFRMADIYLHGPYSPASHIDKTDIGGDVTIDVLEVKE